MKTKSTVIIFGTILGSIIIYNEYQKRRKSVPVFFFNSLPENYNAMTIPPFGIFVKESEKANQELINHEKIHWQQYQNKGLINFYHQYFTELKKFGYDKMPMEQVARINESAYCIENYTECVKNGQAKTVFNPNFKM